MGDNYSDYVLDLLRPLGHVEARRLFGGLGLYFERAIFGFLDEGVLYFKTDANTQSDYESLGSEPFRVTMRGKTVEMAYWRVPEDVVEDSDTLLSFARKALAVAKTPSGKKADRKKKTVAPAAKPKARVK